MFPFLSKLLRICPGLFTLVLFFSVQIARGQSSGYQQLFSQIDSLAKIGLPRSALIKIDEIDSLVRASGDQALQIRVVLYRMNFQSYVEEDAMGAIVGRLRKDIATAGYPVKPVLQSLLAELYWKYYKLNSYKLYNRLPLDQPDPDISHWDLRTIIKETNTLYERSLADYEREQQTPIAVIGTALYGDSSTRVLRPTLYDFLTHRALDFWLSEEPNITKPKIQFSLNDTRFFGDATEFSKLTLASDDTTSLFYKGTRLLQSITAFHVRTGDSAAIADLDLKRLAFMVRKSALPSKDSLFLLALNAIATRFSAQPLSADALYILGDYYKKRERLREAVPFFERAVQLHPGSPGGENSRNVLRSIKSIIASVRFEDANMPGKDLLAFASYRNTGTLVMRLYQLSVSQAADYERIEREEGIIPAKKKLELIGKLAPLRTITLTTPDPGDYKIHTMEFAVDPLRTGNYVYVVAAPGDADSLAMTIGDFRVSRLIVINRGNADAKEELIVMDRETGAPLKGVGVNIEATDGQKKLPPVVHKGLTDAAGRLLFDVPGDFSTRIVATRGKDTLQEFIGTIYGAKIKHEEQGELRTMLFTDRDIYRPGQPVYFKGLRIRTANGRSTVVAGDLAKVALIDANDKELSSVQLKANEFGTFSGSFILPTVMLGGGVRLVTGDDDLWLRVEEYKRPSFSIAFSPVKEAYKFGDLVKVRGTVKAFSGYALAGTRVALQISRSVQANDYSFADQTSEIKTDTITVNETGGFETSFRADGVPGQAGGFGYSYSIDASATDGAGETRSASQRIRIEKIPVFMSVGLEDRSRAGIKQKDRAIIYNRNGQPMQGTVRVKCYELAVPGNNYIERLWERPEQFDGTRESFRKKFPLYAWQNEDLPQYWKVTSRLRDTLIRSDSAGIANIDLSLFDIKHSGVYRLEFYGRTYAGDTSSTVRNVTIVVDPGKKPYGLDNWITSRFEKGDTAAEYFLGSGGHEHILLEVFDGPRILSARWVNTAGRIVSKQVPVPRQAGQDFGAQFMMVAGSRFYTLRTKIPVPGDNPGLKVQLSSYRNTLEPGQKEKWTIKIDGAGEGKEEAELLAGMYDASLNATREPFSTWSNEMREKLYRPVYQYNSWQDSGPISPSYVQNVFSNYFPGPGFSRKYEQLNLLGYSYFGGPNYSYQNYVGGLKTGQGSKTAAPSRVFLGSGAVISPDEGLFATSIDQALQGRLPGLTIDSRNIRVTGTTTIATNPIVSKVPDQEPVVTRRNFNETAFFYPQLRTNEKGEVSFEFTMPEALTEWKFRALAHTRDMKSGYMEMNVVTRKKLMISANMPRFFREGDTMTVAARLVNLTGDPLTVDVRFKLADAVTLKPLRVLSNPADSDQLLSLPGNANQPVFFKIIVPGAAEAINWQLTAKAGDFSDGEENIVPVLPNSVLLTEAMPMLIKPGQQKSFTFASLLEKGATAVNKAVTLEYTQNPLWSVVQSLPYLMESSYESAEQVFSRYYANSIAAAIVRQQPVIRRIFDRWKDQPAAAMLSNLEKNSELKTALLEETPWLREAGTESEQKKRIALLFDADKMTYELAASLDKLKNMQMIGGGFSWFPGGLYADEFITQHILAGAGQLMRLGIVDSNDKQLKQVIKGGLAYLDEVLGRDTNRMLVQPEYSRELSVYTIHAWYARSYFDAPRSAQLESVFEQYVVQAKAEWTRKSIYEQAMIALTLLRNKDSKGAAMILRSLGETAQRSDDLGMYWAANRTGYFWYQGAVETQSLLIELFREAGGSPADIGQMKMWLLRNKQTTNWKTTKATAATCYALLMSDGNLADAAALPLITIGGKKLEELKPGLLAEPGTGYLKTSWTGDAIRPDLGNVTIKNDGGTVNWGALYWQHTEQFDKATSATSGLKIERSYFILKPGPDGPVLKKAGPGTLPATGDLLRVIIHLSAARDYDYIHLKDLRPAGTEPGNISSGYRYQGSVSYYQAMKDASVNFFISSLKKGEYTFQYDLRVSQPGGFSTGVATVECLYAPEFNAHSSGGRIEFR